MTRHNTKLTRHPPARRESPRARRGSPTPPKPPTEGLPPIPRPSLHAPASRAYTLVEMLVVITITSLVLTSVAVALHSLFRVERNLRRDLSVETARARLDVLVRADAHRASAVEAVTRDAETVGIVFTLPDEWRIEYRTEAGHIVRMATAADKVAHREVFRLGDQTRIEWNIEQEQARALVCVTVARLPGRAEAATEGDRTDRLEAVVGLDTAHSRVSTGG